MSIGGSGMDHCHGKLRRELTGVLSNSKHFAISESLYMGFLSLYAFFFITCQLLVSIPPPLFFLVGLYNSLLSISLIGTPVTVRYNKNEPVILLTPLFLLFMDQISWHRALRRQLPHWVTKVEECPLPFKGRKSRAKASSQVGLQLNWSERCWPTGAS